MTHVTKGPKEDDRFYLEKLIARNMVNLAFELWHR